MNNRSDLTKSFDFLQTIINNAMEAIFVLDQKGNYVFINPAAEFITGEDAEKWINKRAGSTIDKDCLKTAQQCFSQAISGQQCKSEIKIKLADNTIRWLNVSYAALQYEEKQYVLCLANDITEQKLIEKKLSAEKNKTQQILDLAEVMYVKLDKNGLIIDLNRKAAEILEVNAEDLLGKSFIELHVPEEARLQVMKVFQDLLSGKIISREYNKNPVISSSGKIKMIYWHNTVDYDDQDNIIGITGAGLDITELENVQAQLVESLEKYRLLAENVEDVIWTMDMDLNFTYISPSTKKMRGFTVKESMEQNIDEIITEDSAAEALNIFKIELEKEKYENADPDRCITFEARHKHQDGHTFWTEQTIKFLRDINNNPIGIIGVTRDISARKEHQAMINALLENIPGMIYCATGSWLVKKIFKSKQLVGYDSEEFLRGEISWYDLIHEDDQERVSIESYNAQERAKSEKSNISSIQKYKVYHQDGTVKLVEDLKTYTIINNQEFRIDGIVIDITKKDEIERKLELSQRMDSVSSLAMGIAHDFNNILTAAMGYLNCLSDSELNQEQKEDLGYIDDSLTKVAELIKQFQSLSKYSIDNPLSYDLYDLVEEIMSFLNRTTDKLIAKTNLIKPKENYVFVDSAQFNQVLLNLAINSVDAIMEKGPASEDFIKAETEKIQINKEDEVIGLKSGNYIHLIFSDSGCGMTDEVKNKAFDPMFTTKDRYTKKGQGLGLAMVYQIIKRLNGFVEIESEQDKGTTFHLYLPETKPAKDEITEVDKISYGHEGILIVEDEPAVINILSKILKKTGYQVYMAYDGEEALQVYQENKNNIDLIILDLTMPKMSGHECMKHILDINPKTRIIIYSGHSKEQIDKDILYKAKKFIPKPFDFDELNQQIRSVLDQ